jgi:hypothetical protein
MSKGALRENQPSDIHGMQQQPYTRVWFFFYISGPICVKIGTENLKVIPLVNCKNRHG